MRMQEIMSMFWNEHGFRTQRWSTYGGGERCQWTFLGRAQQGGLGIRKEEEIQESSAYPVSLEPRIWTKSPVEREGGQQ